ncbi:MAG: hypothetical protein HDR20_05615 [Lachnospiraceae bacterium]|nr:hypothetical protein [Lachnospiraceae bacterium]
MGIGSITSTNSMSSMQTNTAASTDPKIKSIQNEIKDAKQQMQKLSSKEELSASEKADERKKLQKGISRLNTELEQHQETLRKSQKREIMLAELQEDQKLTKEEKSEDKIQPKETSLDKSDEKQQAVRPGTVISRNSDGVVMVKEEMNPDEKRGVDTEKTKDDEAKEKGLDKKGTKATDNDAANASLSPKEIYAITSADSSVQQANRQGTIIAQTRDGIAILKGEIDQDEKRGINTDEKQTALEKMEEREQRAIAFQAAVLGEANNTMKSAVKTNVFGLKDGTQVNVENNAFVKAMNVLQEDDPTQERFHVSFR